MFIIIVIVSSSSSSSRYRRSKESDYENFRLKTIFLHNFRNK